MPRPRSISEVISESSSSDASDASESVFIASEQAGEKLVVTVVVIIVSLPLLSTDSLASSLSMSWSPGDRLRSSSLDSFRALQRPIPVVFVVSFSKVA